MKAPKESQSEAVRATSDTREPEGTLQRRVDEGTRQRAQHDRLAQLQADGNRNGLPPPLKSGIESLSGLDMSDVRVYRNSARPAQLQAHAYAQGADIHLGPGQEEHLPHEAWHVVQQKLGRVKPTIQMKDGVPVNDDRSLEHEADTMGTSAMALGLGTQVSSPLTLEVLESQSTKDKAPMQKMEGVDSTFQLVENRPEASAQRELQENAGNQIGSLEARGAAANFAPGLPIQRRLVLNEVDITDSLETRELEDVVDEVNDAMIADHRVVANENLLADLNESEPKIKKQLAKWIEDAPGLANSSSKSHPIFGRKQQNRNYSNYYDLARALLGWVKGKPVRHVEKEIAEDVYKNASLQAVLNGLCVKLYYKIQNLQADGVDRRTHEEIIQELTTGISIAKGAYNSEQEWVESESGESIQLGHYQRYYSNLKDDISIIGDVSHGVPKNQLEFLRNPGKEEYGGVKEKIIMLHDLMEYFGKRQKWNPKTKGQGLLPVETSAETMVTTEVDPTGERTASISMIADSLPEINRARGKGLTSASRDEDAPSTLLARKLGLPVWAGQSMTTVRMMKLAQWVGASNLENSALAMGIFAYWRKDYDHRSDLAYHTMFEVLDVAKNFGVSYLMKGREHVPPVINMKEVYFESKKRYEVLLDEGRIVSDRLVRLNVRGELGDRIKVLLAEMNEMVSKIKEAFRIVSSIGGADGERRKNISEIVINLEYALQKHREIKAILNQIPIPALKGAPVLAAEGNPVGAAI